jgi:hypothetical protein
LLLHDPMVVPIEEEVVRRIERVRTFESFRLFTERMALIDSLMNLTTSSGTRIDCRAPAAGLGSLILTADVPYNDEVTQRKQDLDMHAWKRSQAAWQLLDRLICHRNERPGHPWDPEVMPCLHHHDRFVAFTSLYSLPHKRTYLVMDFSCHGQALGGRSPQVAIKAEDVVVAFELLARIPEVPTRIGRM